MVMVGGRRPRGRPRQVDGQSAERDETTPDRSKARTEQRSAENAIMMIDPKHGYDRKK